MVVMISGAITGTTDAEERFNNAVTRLKEMGYEKIINPQPLCKVLDYEAEHHEYMALSLKLLDMADMVYFLDGWEKSKGARAEYGVADSKGKILMFEALEEE